MCRVTYNRLMPSDEENFKKSVKDWLKATKRDREWLAEQCGVKKSAVDEWFKKRRDIPTPSAIIIKKLMEESPIKDFGNPPGLPENILNNKLYLSISPDLHETLETQAFLNNMTLSAYCSLIIEWAADHEGIILNDILAMFEKKWKDREEDGEK